MNITKNFKIISLYSTVFLLLSLFTTYLPVWLNKELKLEPVFIGFLLGFIGLLKIISNFLITRKIKNVKYLRITLQLLTLIIISNFFFIVFLDTSKYAVILFILIFFSLLFFSPLIPISETFCLEYNDNFEKLYGKIRLVGSVSFLFGVLIFGNLIDTYSIKIFPTICLFSTLMLFISIFFLPKVKKIKSQALYDNTLKQLLKRKHILSIIIFCSLLQACHAMYYGFSSMLWRENGISYSQIGLLWGWGVVAEILLFYKVNSLNLKKYFYSLLILCGLISAIRWFLMFLTFNFYFLFILQTFHAISFALAHYILMFFIYNFVPKKLRLISNYLYSALSAGLFMTILSITCGILYGLNNKGMGFLLMSFVCLISLLILLKRKEAE